MSRTHLFTSESVTEGHPDKVADAISDAILDAMLDQDSRSRVACETLVTTGTVIVAGEVTTKAYVDIPNVVRNCVKEIGYDRPELGFDYRSCGIHVSLDSQSPDIAQGVDVGAGLHKEQGAGDQGLMFGYATDETKDLMPLTIDLAHRLTKQLATVRKAGVLPWVRTDGKSQVTVEFRDGEPVRVHTVVVSTQHDPMDYSVLKEGVIEEVIKPIIPAGMLDDRTIYHINPTGKFVVGGPHADCGLTGRKIIVDSYGGVGHHGGGAFSGKDPSKVDRSASYFARYIAKNLVAAGLARKAEVQLAYAIGYPQPVSVLVNTFGTSQIAEQSLEELVREFFDCRPAAIIESLDLLRPIYHRTSSYGHFGFNTADMTWEQTDKAAQLAEAAKAFVR